MFLSLVVAAVLAADGGVGAGTPDAGVLGPCRAKQTICFSPLGKCHLPVMDVIDRAQKQLDVAIYALNHAEIVDAVLRAKARGVNVRLVLDTSQMGQAKEIVQLARIQDAGIPMKRDSHSGIMHMKVVVADSREFVTGSFNFTNNASLNNNESLFGWDCPKNAILFQAEFDRLWATFKDAGV